MHDPAPADPSIEGDLEEREIVIWLAALFVLCFALALYSRTYWLLSWSDASFVAGAVGAAIGQMILGGLLPGIALALRRFRNITAGPMVFWALISLGLSGYLAYMAPLVQDGLATDQLAFVTTGAKACVTNGARDPTVARASLGPAYLTAFCTCMARRMATETSSADLLSMQRQGPTGPLVAAWQAAAAPQCRQAAAVAP